MIPDRAYVRLRVLSKNLTPEEISEVIGMGCDSSWRIGDFRRHTTIREKENGWVLDSRLDPTIPLEEHIRALLARISDRSERIRGLAAANSVELSCAVYAKDVPALNFDNLLIRQIAVLGAGLDVDLYLV